MKQNVILSFKGRALNPQDLKGVKGGYVAAGCCIVCPNGTGGTEQYCEDCGIGNNSGCEQTGPTSGIIVCYEGQTNVEGMFYTCKKTNPGA